MTPTYPKYPLDCPHCGIDLTMRNRIYTDETVAATCRGSVDPDGVLDLDGTETDVAWDAAETTEVYCAACKTPIDEQTSDGLATTSVRIRYQAQAYDSVAEHVRRLEGWTVRARWRGQDWIDVQVVEVKIVERGPTEAYYHVQLHEVDDFGFLIADEGREHLVNLYAHGFEMEVY